MSNEFILLVFVLSFLAISAWTLGFFQALTLQRSAVFILASALATALTYVLYKALPQLPVFGLLSKSMGEANYAFLILFIRSLHQHLTRRQEYWGSVAVVVVTLAHLAVNIWVSNLANYLIMSTQVLVLIGWVAWESRALQRSQQSKASVTLLVLVSAHWLGELLARVILGMQMYEAQRQGVHSIWGDMYLEWFWVTFFLGILAQMGVAGVLLTALTQVNEKLTLSKQVLQVMYLDLEAKLKQKDSQLSSLMASRQARAAAPELASLAHELKQPIMSIQLNTEYLMNEQLLNSEQEIEVLNDILQDNRRAAAIIQALRNAFAESVPLDLLPVVDLSHFVQDAARRMGKVMSQRGVNLELNIHPVLQVRAEDIQLGMVIDNLFKNAVEAMDKSAVKNLTVCLARLDQQVVLEVMDSGPGVSAEFQEKIFDMNFTTKAQGMGIGLWLSRRIVHEFAGQLTLLPSVGGAHFKLTLPCLN